MPELLASARGAGSRSFSADPHHGGPCDCRSDVDRLRHRVLPSPDSSRYGNGKPCKFDRQASVSLSAEAEGFVVCCRGCGWTRWSESETTAKAWGRGHEKCPVQKRKTK